MAVGFSVRYLAERQIPLIAKTYSELSAPKLAPFLALAVGICSIIALALLLLSPVFRDFRFTVLKFFSFQLASGEYRILRNTGYTDSWLIEGLLGRLRFTIFPIFFCLAVYPFLRKGYRIFAAIAAITFFLSFPASLSKLPVFFFLGYMTLLLLQRIPRILDIAWMSIFTMVASGLLIACLATLYLAQYQGAISQGEVDPLHLAIERIWGEPFSIVVRYFAVYPDRLPFTGWSGINLAAKAIGLDPRLPDIEVARTILGPDSGSNPTVYFLGGYAAFGTVGLCLFAFLGVMLLWVLDITGRRIHTAPLRATYFAVVGMNVMFLNQIALQTALVTYGLAIAPAVIFVLDRLVVSLFSVDLGSDHKARGKSHG
jgi:hypothetical protein